MMFKQEVEKEYWQTHLFSYDDYVEYSNAYTSLQSMMDFTGRFYDNDPIFMPKERIDFNWRELSDEVLREGRVLSQILHRDVSNDWSNLAASIDNIGKSAHDFLVQQKEEGASNASLRGAIEENRLFAGRELRDLMLGFPNPMYLKLDPRSLADHMILIDSELVRRAKKNGKQS